MRDETKIRLDKSRSESVDGHNDHDREAVRPGLDGPNDREMAFSAFQLTDLFVL